MTTAPQKENLGTTRCRGNYPRRVQPAEGHRGDRPERQNYQVSSSKPEALQGQSHQSEEVCCNIKTWLLEAEEIIKMTHTNLISFKRSLQSKEKQLEDMKTSQDSKCSPGSQTSEEGWKEIRWLKELLIEKEEYITKVERKFNQRTASHIDTIALLTSTENTPKEQERKCTRLEAVFGKQQTDEHQIFQQELKRKEESFMKDCSQRIKKSEQLLCDVLGVESNRKEFDFISHPVRRKDPKQRKKSGSKWPHHTVRRSKAKFSLGCFFKKQKK